MTRSARTFWNRWLPWGILALFWTVKVLPIVRHFTTRHYAIRGPLLDTLNMLWLSWWTEFSTQHAGHSLLHSDLINFPSGASSAVDFSLAFLHVGIAGLLRCCMPDIVAHNLLGLVGLAFSLVAVYLLLKEVAGHGLPAAVFACLVVTFGLATENQLPDLELVYFGYTPLTLLFWLRYVEHGRRGYGIAAVATMAVAAYAQMYYGLTLMAMLGVAALLLGGGLPLFEQEPRVSFRRTAWVFGDGFVLACLLHLRNITNALTADTVVAPEFTAAVPWPFGLTDGLLLVVLCAAPLAVGFWLGARRVALWGALSLPPALLSLGYALSSDWSGDVPMPLAWLRSLLPFVWRITFPNRFVAAMLLALAAALLALWRAVAPLVERRGHWGSAALAGALAAGFWLVAALVPLVPSDCAPLMNMASGADGARLADYPPPGMPVSTLTRPDAARECAGVTSARLPARSLLWPFQGLETVPMPPVPRCLQEIAGDKSAHAILELSRCDVRGYVGYFHTAHHKAIAGYPCRHFQLASRYDEPSRLSRFQASFAEGRADRLLSRTELREAGVDYVVRYAIPGCILAGSHGAGSDEQPHVWSDDDFDGAYGPASCRDAITVVHRLSAPEDD